jgi:ADP-ribose pyrophosphatase YjhB (NUDIX family)
LAGAGCRDGRTLVRAAVREASSLVSGVWWGVDCTSLVVASSEVDASINPALAEASFCPRCGQLADITFPRSIACPHCGYTAYFNPKPVAGAIPVDEEDRVILLRRGFDPAQGRWTFPGGFVDLGESVEDAAHRETNEELGIPIELGPLVGVYSRAEDRVVLIVFLARALGRPQTSPEATEVRSFAEADVPWDELAFWSTNQALRDAFALDLGQR